MTRRLRLAPALLVSALGVALAIHMAPPRAGSAVDPALARAVTGVAIPVEDVDRSVVFYSTVLFFEKVSDERPRGARARIVTMRLGADRIELVQYLGGKGWRDGRRLEHIAIAVDDIDQADLWLRRHDVAPIAPGPQRPDSNPSAGGHRALYFEDPDGHALEIVQFPPGQGDVRWQRPSDRVFLGIDHTAIVVASTDRSLAFYRDALGLRTADASESHGPELERLSDVAGARLRITTLRAALGPAVELLEYLDPRDGRPATRSTLLVTTDADAAAKLGASAAAAGRPVLAAIADPPPGSRRGLTIEDPDGHRVELRARARATQQTE
jgi:catechol 2,3-dioxygenase-like lactoylglutathione lyase family enzyme